MFRRYQSPRSGLLSGGLGGILAIVFALAVPGIALAAEGAYAPQKVVYHVNFYGADHQTAALRNVQNQIDAVGKDNIEVQVVMHGDGLSLLLPADEVAGTKMKEGNADDEMQARIAGLKQQGVKLKICANTLKGRQVDLAALYDADEADVVPSGVAELSKLQGEGFSYIKP